MKVTISLWQRKNVSEFEFKALIGSSYLSKFCFAYFNLRGKSNSTILHNKKMRTLLSLSF